MCLGFSLRTGGGDLITGGDCAGEVFSEYTFNLVNSLIFLLPGKCIPFCTCLDVGDVGQQLQSSSSLVLATRNQLKKP